MSTFTFIGLATVGPRMERVARWTSPDGKAVHSTIAFALNATDREARGTQTRATGLVPGMTVSEAAFGDASKRHFTGRTAKSVHAHRDEVNATAKQGRDAIKAIKTLKANISF